MAFLIVLWLYFVSLQHHLTPLLASSFQLALVTSPGPLAAPVAPPVKPGTAIDCQVSRQSKCLNKIESVPLK